MIDPMRGLEGRVALVTGAGRGIGAAIAARLWEEGAAVAVTDREPAWADEVAARLGDRCVALPLDVTSPGSIAEAVTGIEDTLGPVDALINNAGWDTAWERYPQEDDGVREALIDINLKGPMNTTAVLVPRMIERAAGGRIVNVSSDAARVGMAGGAVYAAAKAGVIGFTKSLAMELGRAGITVNVVCPGMTDTPLLEQVLGGANQRRMDALRSTVPLRRIGQPEDLASAVTFLASDDAAYITGQVLSVNGGMTMVG